MKRARQETDGGNAGGGRKGAELLRADGKPDMRCKANREVEGVQPRLKADGTLDMRCKANREVEGGRPRLKADGTLDMRCKANREVGDGGPRLKADGTLDMRCKANREVGDGGPRLKADVWGGGPRLKADGTPDMRCKSNREVVQVDDGAGGGAGGRRKKQRLMQQQSSSLEVSPLRRRVSAPPPGSIAPAGPASPAAKHVIAHSQRKTRKQVGPPQVLEVSEVSVSDGRSFAEARSALKWDSIQRWANTKHRTVVQRRDLKRLWDFTNKILTVRRADGVLAGCALLCEASEYALVCDTLCHHTNPSMPQIKTSRMSDFGDIREQHVRSAFGRQHIDVPIDELVLICGERGTGKAVMAHLADRQRILFASVVPGSDAVQSFYNKHFRPLAFERDNGEQPYAVWLGRE